MSPARPTLCRRPPSRRPQAVRERAFGVEERGRAREVLVDLAGALATLADGPHHERLAAPHVAGREDALPRGAVAVSRRSCRARPCPRRGPRGRRARDAGSPWPAAPAGPAVRARCPATSSGRPAPHSARTARMARSRPGLVASRNAFESDRPVALAALGLRARGREHAWPRVRCGQGVWSVRPSGGLGMISICVTERAPWRIEVPTQSEPVSPPPMTTTSLPVARMASVLRGWRRPRRAGSTASGSPWRTRRRRRSRPGMGRSRGAVEPPARTTASKSASELRWPG